MHALILQASSSPLPLDNLNDNPVFDKLQNTTKSIPDDGKVLGDAMNLLSNLDNDSFQCTRWPCISLSRYWAHCRPAINLKKMSKAFR